MIGRCAENVDEYPMVNGEWRVCRASAPACFDGEMPPIAKRCNRGRMLYIFVVPALFGIVISGCKPAAPPEPKKVTDSAERGPIKFSVTATPADAWIGDPITITMTAGVPEDIAVELPNQTVLGEVNIRSAGTPTSRPSESGSVWQQSYVIDTLATGSLEIPPLVMKYGKKPATDGAPQFDNELAIGTLRINIRSALTSQDTMTAPRDISGARTPPPEPWEAWQIAVLAGLCIAGLAALWLLVSAVREWRNRSSPPLAPEIWALRELDRLGKYDWAGTGQVRECYYRLTEITRGYIESKFGLKAPEMTTEEFLRVLARDQSALPYDAVRLRGFLETCDMVKYAAVSPQREEIDAALSHGRAFVNATAAAYERHVERLKASEPRMPTSGNPAEPRTSVSGFSGADAGTRSLTVGARLDEHAADANDAHRWMGSRDDPGGRAA